MRIAIASLAAYLLCGVMWFLAASGPRRAARSWSEAPPDLVEAAILLAALVAIWPADVWFSAQRRRAGSPAAGDWLWRMAPMTTTLTTARHDRRCPQGGSSAMQGNAMQQVDAQTTNQAALATAAKHWATRRTADGSRWWMHPVIHQHINRLVCGEDIDGVHAGFHRLIEEAAPADGFQRAISIGCGSGGKEMRLLRSGSVKHFDLFEIGEHRRDLIKAKALEFGVADRVTIHIGNAFEAAPAPRFDLVYWNNALHHMFDAAEAARWSHSSLRAGGCFAADDFVGPSRFQWTNEELDLVFRARSVLPDRLLTDPRDRQRQLPLKVERPDVAEMMRVDPTESADSAGIIPAITSTFPNARIIPTGGVVYHLVLNDVLANVDYENADDRALLQCLLLLDEQLARSGHTHYAVALATR